MSNCDGKERFENSLRARADHYQSDSSLFGIFAHLVMTLNNKLLEVMQPKPKLQETGSLNGENRRVTEVQFYR